MKVMVTTPIDTGYYARIVGDAYQRLLYVGEGNVITRVLIEEYVYWREHGGTYGDPSKVSTTLWDVVAVWLAQSERVEECVSIVGMNITVTDDGYTKRDDMNGHVVEVALAWKDLDGFLDEVVELLAN